MSAITQIEEDWDAIGPSAVAAAPELVKRLRSLERLAGIPVRDRWQIGEAADMIETLADYASYIAVCHFMGSAGKC